MEKLKEYAELEESRRELEEKLKKVKERQELIKQDALDEFINDGMERITLNGLTLSPRRRIYAGIQNGYCRDDVAHALKESGLNQYVSETYNALSLHAYVRGLAEESFNPDTITPQEIQNYLPEPLKNVLQVGEAWDINIRKA